MPSGGITSSGGAGGVHQAGSNEGGSGSGGFDGLGGGGGLLGDNSGGSSSGGAVSLYVCLVVELLQVRICVRRVRAVFAVPLCGHPCS